uniref:ORF4 n=1 Tax=Rodent Torque teno virus 1 TaxID=1514664 RepID=X2G8C5_9VIRU|nr:ORF4 [Rodent Torque teno virus 1]AHN14867.1 ORF4 [Rodent Torque teno virus 1]AHN14871.1 ORF4 [Rodent Torque teno virus 1]
MVANPRRPMQWEWPADGECDEAAWRRITRPIEETQHTFSAFQGQKKVQKKAKVKREKEKVHNKQEHRHQLDRILRILNRVICI